MVTLVAACIIRVRDGKLTFVDSNHRLWTNMDSVFDWFKSRYSLSCQTFHKPTIFTRPAWDQWNRFAPKHTVTGAIFQWSWVIPRVPPASKEDVYLLVQKRWTKSGGRCKCVPINLLAHMTDEQFNTARWLKGPMTGRFVARFSELRP